MTTTKDAKAAASVLIVAAIASTALAYPLFCAAPASAAMYVSLSVTGQAVPSSIGPGENGNLVLTITNAGTEYARNVKLFVKPNSQAVFGQQNYDLQTIAPSTTTQVSVPITISTSATEGATTVFLSLSYNEGGSVGTVTTETSVPLAISKRSLVQIETVTWSKETIEPGDTVDMSVQLKNVGASDISYMTVTLGDSSQPFVAASGDTEAYVGSLPKGSASSAGFSIVVNRDAKTVAYRVPVVVAYYDDSGSSHSDTKYIGLRVSGAPEFVVALEDDSSAMAGLTGELTISIANRGTATANLMTLEFESDTAVAPAEYYVGNMDPDDFQTVKVSVDLAGVAPGARDLAITMLYKDPYNQDVTGHSTVQFYVRPLQAVSVSPTTVIVILAITAATLYWKRAWLVGFLQRMRRPKG